MLVPLFHDIDYRLAARRSAASRCEARAPFVNYSRGREASQTAAPRGRAAARAAAFSRADRRARSATWIPRVRDRRAERGASRRLRDAHARRRGRAGRALARRRGAGRGRRPALPLPAARRRPLPRRPAADGARRALLASSGCCRASESDRRAGLCSPIRGAKALLAGEATDLEGFRIVSPTEFSIELEKPVAFFPALMSDRRPSIVPEGTTHPGTLARGVRRHRPVPRRRLRAGPAARARAQPRTTGATGFPRSEGSSSASASDPRRCAPEFRAGRFSVASDLLPRRRRGAAAGSELCDAVPRDRRGSRRTSSPSTAHRAGFRRRGVRRGIRRRSTCRPSCGRRSDGWRSRRTA